MFPLLRRSSSFKKKCFLASAIGVLFFCLLAFFLKFKADTIRRFNVIQSNQRNNTVFFDIDQQPFRVIRGAENRKYVKLEHISRNLQKAVVAIEDGRFFTHFGFDPIRLTLVILRNLTNTTMGQGASTITQQLVKLTLLTPERSLERKLKELFMAVALEMEFSKAEILEFYLNKVYLGHRNYGVENASLNYFHKPTAKLTIAESAFIAGLIKKPEGYSPFVNLKKARQRQILALKRLRKLGWITERQYVEAVNEHILIRESRKKSLQIAPYFTNHILLKLKERYGHTTVYGGGLRIYTTLDTKLQRAMERVIAARMVKPHSFEQVAGVSIDPTTGFVKALVGGVDFYQSEFNRITQAKRQPGSSFKPILYSAALSKGIKPNDTFWDEPTQYTRLMDDKLEIYEPGNFSGEHLGQITMAYALRVSNNVVSVKILNKIGIRTLDKMSTRFGIDLPANRGLCLALGCGETTLLNLTNAYSVFANQGFMSAPVFILKVTDSKGNILEKYQVKKEFQVLSVNQAFQMNHLLQDVVNYGTGRQARIGRPSGGKTGTSDQNRDAIYIGFVPELVSGFWVGNDDNRPMDNEVGGRTPARLWRRYMSSLPSTDIQKDFAINENFEDYMVCDSSGKLATNWCPSTAWYSLRANDSPLEYCDIHNETSVQVNVCGSSGKLATENCPVGERQLRSYVPGTEPTEDCDVHRGNAPVTEETH